jgi:DNA-binding FrmR family transcriptional regulator
MPSKNDFFNYAGERLRRAEGTKFARERALLANTECLTVLAQLRIRHRRVDVRSGCAP